MPLRDFKNITKIIKKLVNSNFHSVWTVSKLDTKYHPLKQLAVKNNKIDFQQKGHKIIARQQLKETYIRNGEGYAVKRKYFVKIKMFLQKIMVLLYLKIFHGQLIVCLI